MIYRCSSHTIAVSDGPAFSSVNSQMGPRFACHRWAICLFESCVYRRAHVSTFTFMSLFIEHSQDDSIRSPAGQTYTKGGSTTDGGSRCLRNDTYVIHHAFIMHASLCMHQSCIVHASCMHHAFIMNAARMRHSYIVHASLMHHSCVIIATRMHHACISVVHGAFTLAYVCCAQQ